MKPVLLRIAASTLAIGVTTLSIGTVATAAEEGDVAQAQDEAAQAAAEAAASARAALADRNGDRAVSNAERAVEMAPRSAEYRALLGDAYLAAGRFGSAETSFLDALALDPNMTSASMSLALSQIALGKRDEARGELSDLVGRGDPADVGLALALAGDTDRALAILLDAARAETATARDRQNFALALALAGRWAESRLVVTQDVPLGSITDRMTEWARFAQPANSWDQVASLLGVTPSEDPGQPVRLALAPALADSPVLLAAVEDAPVEEYVAEAQPMIAPMVALASAPVEENAPVGMFAPVANAVEVAERFAAPAVDIPTPVERAPVTVHRDGPSAPVQIAAASAATPASVVAAPRRASRRVPAATPRTSENGRFVVQLGSFQVPTNVDVAWSRALGEHQLNSFEPKTATFNRRALPATMHRLSVGDFASWDQARGLCARIQGDGGDCFVRERAGDVPIAMARRNAGSAQRAAR